MRGLLICIALMWPGLAVAQMKDSVFRDYDEYARFLNDNFAKRDFVKVIQVLGGRDEYTPEELNSVNYQLMSAFPSDFKNHAVFRRVEMGGGVTQEGRVYWTGLSYLWFYAVLHQRADALVVVNFHFNGSAQEVLNRF